jgi:hypothetical protein
VDNRQLSFDVDPYIDHELFDDIAPHIKEQFKQYHKDNPHVFDLFLNYGRQLLKANRKHYSSRIIIERIRWHLNVETTGDEFKINNNYCSCYGRLLVAKYPDEFGNMFEFRKTPGVVYGS